MIECKYKYSLIIRIFALILLISEILILVTRFNEANLLTIILGIILFLSIPLSLFLSPKNEVVLDTNNKILTIKHVFNEKRVLINQITNIKIVWIAAEVPFINLTYILNNQEHQTKFGIWWFDEEKLQNILNLLSQNNHSISLISLSEYYHMKFI